MSQEDRDKWNQRYTENTNRKGNPVTLLENWISKAPMGRALDIASGAGRNAVFMAQSGFEVDAIDISPAGLAKARETAEIKGFVINWIEHDLDEPYEFKNDYELIVVLWYVNLPLITHLCDCLAPGGILICEEHLVSDQEVIGPGNPHYRVKSGALREAVSSLEILYYEESIEGNEIGEPVSSARVVARKTLT